jgi:hypothetical protein
LTEELVHIEVPTVRDGSDFLETLARHGLVAALADEEAGWGVEVSSHGEDTAELLRELIDALDPWLGERGLATLTVRVT